MAELTTLPLEASEPSAPNIILPPSQAELPYDDDTPMDSPRHKVQIELLIDTLLPWLEQRSDGYIGGNMFVYFSMAQVRNQDFRGPDFFAVLGVPKGERLSWVVWEEDKAPDVVIELLSESTAERDKTEKKQVYQDKLRVPEYFWYDPFNPSDWAGFTLRGGVYQPLTPTAQDQLVSQAMGLALVRWQATYKDIDATWLRWATLNGELLPTPQEIAEQERQRAGHERREKELAQQQVEQERREKELANSQLQQVILNLLQEGMSVEQVARVTGFAQTQVEQIRSSSP